MSEKKLSFLEQIGKSNLRTHSEVLEIYKKNIDDIIKLKGKTPIFLDTNVLLKSYSISFQARENLLKFYEKYKDRIILTNQVQKEFIKNREDIIERFYDDITNKLPKTFKEEVLNKLSSFLQSNKTVLVDYKDFENGLNKIYKKLNDLSKELVTLIGEKEKNNNDILLNDDFLKTFTQCTLLSEEIIDIEKCKKEFDVLSQNIKPEKINTELNKPGKVFPGMGDIQKKPEDPYGDYLIFNELMAYANNESTDIIFLTYDTTKGDWMNLKKSPHIHYLENFYLNTNKMVYILDAQRIFEETLNINFKSLININSETQEENLSSYELKILLKELYPSQESPTLNQLNDLIEELNYNDYSDISSIANDAQRANSAFQEYLSDREDNKNRFSQIGNLRLRLEMSNDVYTKLNSSTGKPYPRSGNLRDQYGHLVE